jgi:proteasome alpha subunit
LTFDGSVGDEHGFVAMGGAAEAIAGQLQEQWQPDLTLPAALQMAVAALSEHGGQGPRTLADKQLEVAVLDRTRPRRAFRRLVGDELTRLLNSE